MRFFNLVTDPTTRKGLRALFGFLLLAVLSVFFLLLFSLRFLYSPIATLATLTTPVSIEVQAGSSFSRVSQELNEAGYIKYPIIFRLLAKWRDVENSIKLGEYELSPGTSPAQLLSALVQGDTIQYRVTLLEGWTFDEALAAIWQSEKVLPDLLSASPAQIAQSLDSNHENPEGLLFPDTYFYTAGTTDAELLRRAHEKLQQVLQSEWDSRLGALPYENSYDALIMASIIEKESALASERGHIAGVFVHRLELGMRLQSDPTVIYGMRDDYDGNILRQDLLTQTPYNTYRISGLPPTPIALAGLESIRASLNPLQSDYLYFVAKGDGEHYFSSNLQEHNQAVNRYQRQVAEL